MSKEKIFIISGEDSGDLHGAKLIASIKQVNPNTEFFGIGGNRMQKEGLQLTEHIKNLNSVSKEDALLIEILEERYVTFFGQIEGFNDVRRTRKEEVGIRLQPNTGSLLPERFLYPQSEIDSNPNTPSPLPGFFEPTEVNQ